MAKGGRDGPASSEEIRRWGIVPYPTAKAIASLIAASETAEALLMTPEKRAEILAAFQKEIAALTDDERKAAEILGR